jgi:hypothetical protein
MRGFGWSGERTVKEVTIGLVNKWEKWQGVIGI